MDITWLGHACFRLRAGELVVITDPFPLALGLKPDSQTASVVTVSNAHPNHSSWSHIPGEPRLLDSPGEYEYAGTYVRGVMSSLPPETPQAQRNVVYSIEIDGVHICHLGDIAVPLSARQTEELSPVDVLLVPTGGGCTLNMDGVWELMQELAPKMVIPMHYKIPGVSVPLEGMETFLRRMGISEVKPQSRVLVTHTNLPAVMTVVVLEPQAREA